jgi:WD40 repeat protein
MVAAGKAKVTISFDAWKQGNVAVAHQEMEIVPAVPDPRLETVSSLLQGELIHTNIKGTLQGLRFSPDGKRLLAGDGSAGIIQIWDVGSKKPLTSIEAGKTASERGGGGSRGGGASFVMSPDWQKLYAKNGAEVGVWDPKSGKQIDTFQDKQAASIRSLMLSADGNALITTGGGKSGGALIWDTATKKAQALPGNLSAGALSRDGKTFASVQGEGGFYSSAIQVIDLETRQVKTNIAMPHKLAHAYVTDFSPDGKILRGAIEIYDEHLWQKWEKWQYTTKFWDVATGKEVASFPTDEPETTYTMASYSPDGKTLAGSRWTPRHGTRAEKLHAHLTNGAKLFLLDVPGKRTRDIILEKEAVVAAIAISPDSKWVAVVTQARGEGGRSEAGEGDTVPQPRIHLVDAQTAEVREALIAPPGPITALSFSSDGRTLASAGIGKVLLWSLPSSK